MIRLFCVFCFFLTRLFYCTFARLKIINNFFLLLNLFITFVYRRDYKTHYFNIIEFRTITRVVRRPAFCTSHKSINQNEEII